MPGTATCQMLPVRLISESSLISTVALPLFKSARVNSTRYTAEADDEKSAKLCAPCRAPSPACARALPQGIAAGGLQSQASYELTRSRL